jgi:hypothetical protein
MQDPKGEHVDGGDTNLNHFSEAVFLCPVVVATEPAYALARQVKKMRQKRADKKAAEEEGSSDNAKKEKWHGDDKKEQSDSDYEQSDPWAPQPSEVRREKQKWAETQARVRFCTPKCPGYHKDKCLAHTKKQPQEVTSSGASTD